MENLKIHDPDRSRELALERGDNTVINRDGRVDIQINEKELGSGPSASAPQWRPEDALGGSIEGHVPQELGSKRSTQDEGDLLDQI
jgi:hypothetical protein